MTWDDIARVQYNRDGLRYPSDLTDREWEIIKPFIPPAKHGGRKRKTDMREVMNAILYIASSGCQWRMLPKSFPPISTVRYYFYQWRDMELWTRINFMLVMETRELEGKEASPTACIIDSQSVKTTESGGVRGYDAGKKIKGRKRHIVVDTLGLLLNINVHSADIQDRDGGVEVIKEIKHKYPWLKKIFADGGYQGKKFRGELKKFCNWAVEIIKRSDKAEGFEVLPRRWVVERTFAWLGRCRRLAKDWENSIASSEAWARIAHIRMMTRRLATYCFVT